MRIVFLSILFIFSFTGKSQSLSATDGNISTAERYAKSYASILVFAESTEIAKDYAKKDIENNIIFLFLENKNARLIYTTDLDIKKKYNIYFNELGYARSDYAILYNQVMFDYLYKKYGNKWMTEIRKDTIGFKDWKKTLKKK